jgi:two-component system chemotaxis response regulator CheB
MMPSYNIVVIGSSTGGLKVLEELLPRLNELKAAVLIVQHITPLIDRAFVTSLTRVSKMPVMLAHDGQSLQQGQVVLAPGGFHLYLVRNQLVRLATGEKVNSVCPSVDVTMKSFVAVPGAKIAGVVLTGMGCDGAAGIAHIKQVGGITVAQDQKTSVIYGMPRAAVETGKVDFVLPTDRIAAKLNELFG